MTKKEHIYVTCLLSAWLTQELMDELKQTNAYRHELKKTGKMFARELEKITTDDIPLIWGIDDKAMYALLEYQKEVIQALSTMRPEDIGIVKEMIEMYKAHPRKVLNRLQIKIVTSSELPEKEEAAA